MIETATVHRMSVRLVILLSTATLAIVANDDYADGICAAADFDYRYTECDTRGERWRYAVPKPNARRCAAAAPPPRPGLNCSFTCPAGNYLDLESQTCRRCQPGTYSLGDGVRYEHLSTMPPGFTVENFPDETEQLFGETKNDAGTTVCSNRVGWVVENGELRYVPTSCVSKLTISVNLVHDGYIQFYYKWPRNGRSLLSILQVRNSLCQSYGNTRNMFMHAIGRLTRGGGDATPPNTATATAPPPVAGEFQTRRIPIHAGQNLLTWTVANNRELTTLADIIYVPTVDIVGLAFTPLCSTCPAGTYSLSGAQKCQICAAGTFSTSGASFCQKCQPTEYSEPKAAKCQRRPVCEPLDYYTVRPAECNANATDGALKIARVEPKICAEHSPPPSPAATENPNGICSRCRAGQRRSLTTGRCEYCGVDEFSDDGRDCKKCSANTIPIHGLYFDQWDVLPAEVSTSCEYLFAGPAECQLSVAWIVRGDRVESAPIRARGVALSLAVEVPTGFYDPLRAGGQAARPTLENPIAELSLDVELKCADSSCQMYIVQESVNKTTSIGNTGSSEGQGAFTILAAFNGSLSRQIIRLPIVDARPARFVVAFMRSHVDTAADALSDRASIFALNVSHVGDAAARRPAGGAAACVPCPSRDMVTGRCEPCPIGHYLSEQNTCTKCPFGTALNVTSGRCTPCGENLGSDDGTECTFSGRFALNSTIDDTDDGAKFIQFDVSRLKERILKADGIRVFAREGNSYFHTFNVSLFGEPVQCRDSYDLSGNPSGPVGMAKNAPQFDEDNALFCRASAIPSTTMPAYEGNSSTGAANGKPTKSAENIVYISSTVIGRKIAAITQSRTFRGFHLLNDQLDYDSSLSSTARPTDVHVFYEPLATRLTSCPLGALGVVTLRCELTAADNPIVRLSRKCPDGTCDGCLYHVIVETALACPICHPADFKEIRGECIDNLQKIHYIPSKHCVLSGAQNRERTEACSTVSDRVFLLLLLAALVITCLVVLVLIIYEKNKSLEYRYMRIVEGRDMDDLNSCALKSDEDEEEEELEQEHTSDGQKDISKTQVRFQKNKNNNYMVTMNNKNKNNNNNSESCQFLSASSDEG